MKKIELDAIGAIIDAIDNGATTEDYNDLHQHAFNDDYFYIYYSDAREVLNDYDVFDAIEKIVEYEKFNFGEVNTDFSNPCDVANMLLYIIGEEILWKLESYQEHADDTPTAEIDGEIKEECRRMLEAA